jgi:hypothetical protein
MGFPVTINGATYNESDFSGYGYKNKLPELISDTATECADQVAAATTQVTAAEAQADEATTQAGIATAQAGIATTQAGLAEADAIATAADRVQTGLDVIATAADRVQTGLDRSAVSGMLASIAAGPVVSINGMTGIVTLELTSDTISGPTSLYVNASGSYTITNYDTEATYTISAVSGSVSRTGDTITYTAPATTGTGGFVVNGRTFTVTIAELTIGVIGTQGTQGFGVGIYPTTLPSGFSNLASNTDKAHANYGNYQTTNGSIMVFVPRFYYRIGSASSPRYATYGANAIDVVGVETYATEALANAAGYAMHRAFKDGGADKSGFFIDKYLASKDGTTSCKSIASADPISLTTSAGYNPSNGMTGCTGILADAVVLSRARGSGTFNTASIFMYSACALLSLAHAQASTATTYCAWYSAGSTNFPKGCNNGALADTNDATVTYAVASTSPKPLTRATANFAKTTHNGQDCGVADLNGSMYQVALGITNPGTSGTDTTLQGNGNAYVLKSSVALASLTSGWTSGASGTDAWGDAAHLGLLYDSTASLFPWGATTGWTYFGNGSNQVFSGATSGTDWLQTACGVQDTTSSTSAGGTAQFGADGCYQYNLANLFPLCAGYWGDAANAGVFCRYWNFYRSNDYNVCGFRAGAYGS